MLLAEFRNSDLFSQTGKFENRLLGPTIIFVPLFLTAYSQTHFSISNFGYLASSRPMKPYVQKQLVNRLPPRSNRLEALRCAG
jgi:hypothetical protein